MSEFEKNITFIIVSFRSDNVIQKCIESISPNCKVIVVENSQNTSIKKYLEKKFSNVRVLITGENLGYGRGNNLGISKVKTKYAFILNPDAYLEKNTLKELNNTKCILQEEFSILSPIICDNKKYYKSFNGKEKNFIEVDFVKGFAMLLNLEKINFNEIFDKKIFLFLEEIDLCKRIKESGGKIYIACKGKIYHNAKESSGNEFEIELCRNWHWMWSLYYYNFKHFGMFSAYKITLYKFISSLLKILLSIILIKKKKYLIHKYRLLGLINAYKKKDSWLRPHHISNI
jgi:N-acetylglucosaminyl-diphospho-decaprenol L-rhamnosyltransferase